MRFSSVPPSHLALQLRNSFSKLGLQGFWQLRVEAVREVLHAVLLVLVLQSEAGKVQILMSDPTMRSGSLGSISSYVTLHVGEVPGELGVQRVGQLVVNRRGQRLFDRLFISDLRDREGEDQLPAAPGPPPEPSPGLHLTLQLGSLSGVLRLQSFGQLVIQSFGRLLPAGLSVLPLDDTGRGSTVTLGHI